MRRWEAELYLAKRQTLKTELGEIQTEWMFWRIGLPWSALPQMHLQVLNTAWQPKSASHRGFSHFSTSSPRRSPKPRTKSVNGHLDPHGTDPLSSCPSGRSQLSIPLVTYSCQAWIQLAWPLLVALIPWNGLVTEVSRCCATHTCSNRCAEPTWSQASHNHLTDI